jgi:hypothetical protein
MEYFIFLSTCIGLSLSLIGLWMWIEGMGHLEPRLLRALGYCRQPSLPKGACLTWPHPLASGASFSEPAQPRLRLVWSRPEPSIS